MHGGFRHPPRLPISAPLGLKGADRVALNPANLLSWAWEATFWGEKQETLVSYLFVRDSPLYSNAHNALLI